MKSEGGRGRARSEEEERGEKGKIEERRGRARREEGKREKLMIRFCPLRQSFIPKIYYG
jgi:hypothetical protein